MKKRGKKQPGKKKPARKSREQGLTPDRILQLGFAFWGSKTLLSAIDMGLFTELAREPMDAAQVQARLQLHPRSVHDFLDALVALGMLERKGTTYRNTPETELFLDRAKPSYAGGMLEMANNRLFRFWDALPEALRTGQPQNEAKAGGSLFAALYADPARLEGFLQAMTGLSTGAGMAMARKFPWKKYKTFVDVGAAQGAIPVQLCLRHPHLTGASFDLPVVGPIYERFVRSFKLEHRLRFLPGDFFADPLPEADVLIMGHILHDWDLEQKRELVAKAYRALPKGGAYVVHESIIDDKRRRNAFGLLMSLNMLIETPGGFDYTGADCRKWMREAGFRKTSVVPLVGPDSMVIGVK